MKKPKFKIGDLVVCVDDKNYCHSILNKKCIIKNCQSLMIMIIT